MKQTINQIQFTCFCINQSARGTKKTKESIMSRFPSPVFWQRGQWRKFKSDELFKKGGTLPSGLSWSPCPKYSQDLTPLDLSCKLWSMQRKMEGTWQPMEVWRLREKNPILEKTKRCPMTDKKVPESFHRHAPHWPDLQDKLETFVMEQRAACIALNTVQLRLK